MSVAPDAWLPLLGAKLRPPRLPSYTVARPRVADQLGGSWRVAVITGGPGTGKTVVASQWLEMLEATGRAWVSLDAADDRPAQFWLAVAAALDRAEMDAFPRSAALAFGGRSDEAQFLAELVADAAALERPVALVLDDLHTIRDPRILRGLAFLVDHLESGIQLVITSRADPALPIGRWRTRPWFVELRQADLDFTRGEAVALFTAMGEERLDADGIERFRSHTEGWAAALQLGALSMRRHDDPSAVAERMTGRHYMVADLLLSEVVEQQTDEMREFMLDISVAGHFDAELCDALTGRTDSAELLRTLQTQMLFLLAVDDERSTFRFHHLLGELLRAELKRRHPGRAEQLHRIAADVCAARGEVVAAIHHLLSVGDRDRAFALAFGSAFVRWDHGDISAAASWIDLFPADYLEETAERMLAYALALGICTRLDEALAWLERGTARIRSDPQPSEEDIAIVDAVRLLLLSCHDIADDGIECGRRAVEAADRGLRLGTAGARARPNLARAFLLEDRPDDAHDVLVTSAPGDEVSTLLSVPAVTARIALRRGLLTEAQETAVRALSGAAVLGVRQHFATLDAHLARAGVLTDRYDLTEAAELFELMRELADHYALTVYTVLVRVDEVRVVAAREGIDAARRVIDEMRLAAGSRTHRRLQRIVDTVEARWLIESDEIPRAAEVIARLPPHSTSRTLLEARLHLASNRPERAARLIDRPFGNVRDQLCAELLGTRAAHQLGDPSIDEHLAHVVTLASAEGHVLTIVEEGPAVARLVRMSAERSDTAAGEQLAVALGAAPRPRRVPRPKVLLTERELAVLRYLPSRMTNQEIARELFMSVNTVKTHLKSIYAKVGAVSRSDALRRAKALDLV